MNERLKEIMNQSMEYYSNRYVDCPELNPEKFAELIVKQCLDLVKQNIYGPCGEYDYSYTREKAAADERAEMILDDIESYFGIKNERAN